MKKIIITLFFLLVSFFGIKEVCAVQLPSNDNISETYNIYSKTYEITIDYKLTNENLVFDGTKLSQVESNNSLKFIVFNASDTNIFLYNGDDIAKVFSLKFVNPETVMIKKDEDDTYYVAHDDTKLYGEFEWLVDGKTVSGETVKGDEVILIYNNLEIPYIVETKTSILNDYIVIFLGLPIFIFILCYVVYLVIPVNNYKRIYKSSAKLKRSLEKHQHTYNKIIFTLKIKLPILNNLVATVDETDPKYKAFKKVKSDLDLALNNAIKLENHFPALSVDDFLVYINRKLDVYIALTENGKYKFKKEVSLKNNKSKIKTTEELTRDQKDAFRYLEGIHVIDIDELHSDGK